MHKKNTLVIGSGGREALLAYELNKSNQIDKVYLAPGNDTKYPDNINRANIKPDYPYCKHLLTFIKNNNIGLVVSGSENDLVKNLGDIIRMNGILFVGVGGGASLFESDKAFASTFRQALNIPQPQFVIFDDSQKYSLALDYCKNTFKYKRASKLVLKHSGLAGGKGVIIVNNNNEATKALKKLQHLNSYNDSIVIEDFIKGTEVSVTAFVGTDTHYNLLSFSQDYKQAYDNDTGPNTGGMGAVTLDINASSLTTQLTYKINKIVRETITGAANIGRSMAGGFLYIGLMIDKDNNPYVLEYNMRLGDPEAQVIIPRIDYDLGEIFIEYANGNPSYIYKKPEHYATVVMAAKGYPGDYSENEGKLIEGIEDAQKMDNVFINLAGTTYRDGKYYIKGSRNINVIAKGKTPQKAVKKAYEAVNKIKSDGLFYRTDIGCNVPKF